MLLQKIQNAQMILNVDKCDLSKSEIHFLGHTISADGIRPDSGKTEAMRKMQLPSNISEVQSFQGMVNQLGKFIPQLTLKVKPLRGLLSKQNSWVWETE